MNGQLFLIIHSVVGLNYVSKVSISRLMKMGYSRAHHYFESLQLYGLIVSEGDKYRVSLVSPLPEIYRKRDLFFGHFFISRDEQEDFRRVFEDLSNLLDSYDLE